MRFATPLPEFTRVSRLIFLGGLDDALELLALGVYSASVGIAQSHCLGRGCGTGQSADRHRSSGSRSHGPQVAPLFCEPGSGWFAGCSSFRTAPAAWSGNPAASAVPVVPAARTLHPLVR